MTNEKQAPEYLPIPTKAGTASHPGRTSETKKEKELRYSAQLISKHHGIPLLQALEVAKRQADDSEKKAREQESRKEKQRNQQRERRHEQAKRSTVPVTETHGPPVQGGAPGLGK
jgi:hypothetical protein